MEANWIVMDQPELRERIRQLGFSAQLFDGQWSSQVNGGLESAASELAAVLEWRDGVLQLRSLDKALGKPIIVDFIEGKTGFRSQRANHEMIVKAVAGRSKDRMQILDASAGLGRDSFILAAAGYEVVSLERNPVIACLLKDGLDRAQMHSQAAPVAARIQLKQVDAIRWLKQCDAEQAPQVIYLDPMFPERNKSALVKKEMRIFRELVGDDDDAELLLQSALSVAQKRVVVKRPRKASGIGQHKPSYQITGKNSRFDVYQV